MKKPHRRTIRPDPDFTPMPVSDGDELFTNGIFVFNISKIVNRLQKEPSFGEQARVQVHDFPTDFSRIDESHVEKVDPSVPIILAEISPGRFNIIDGNHRVEKARRLGITSLQAFRLTPDKHIQFLTSKKAYLAFIDYWNGKIQDGKFGNE